MISVRVFNYISEKSFGRNISLRLHLRLGLRLRTLVNMGKGFFSLLNESDVYLAFKREKIWGKPCNCENKPANVEILKNIKRSNL